MTAQKCSSIFRSKSQFTWLRIYFSTSVYQFRESAQIQPLVKKTIYYFHDSLTLYLDCCLLEIVITDTSDTTYVNNFFCIKPWHCALTFWLQYSKIAVQGYFIGMEKTTTTIKNWHKNMLNQKTKTLKIKLTWTSSKSFFQRFYFSKRPLQYVFRLKKFNANLKLVRIMQLFLRPRVSAKSMNMYPTAACDARLLTYEKQFHHKIKAKVNSL